MIPLWTGCYLVSQGLEAAVLNPIVSTCPHGLTYKAAEQLEALVEHWELVIEGSVPELYE